MTRANESGPWANARKDWSRVPFKRLVDGPQVRQRSSGRLLSVYLDQGVIPFQDAGPTRVHNPSESLASYQPVLPGDLVMNNQQAWRGSVGVSQLEGLVSPAYHVLALEQSRIDPRYGHWLFRAPQMIDLYEQCSNGIGSIQRNLALDALRQLAVPLPPLDVQERIADFLDDQTTRIDNIISARERQSELLEEWLTAEVIWSTTVAGAKNLRDGGPSWASVFNSDWRLAPHRAVMSIKQELVGDSWDRYTLLSLTRRGIIPRDLTDNSGKFPASFETYQRVLPDDLVMCMFDVKETPRTVGLVETEGMVTGAYTRFQVNRNLANPSYLRWYLIGVDDRKAFEPLYTGMRNTIQKDRFLSATFPLPPLAEQEEIADHLNHALLSVEGSRDMVGSAIKALKELKRSLISAAVSGEFDVSSADGIGLVV